jgi:hypothetical protein
VISLGLKTVDMVLWAEREGALLEGAVVLGFSFGDFCSVGFVRRSVGRDGPWGCLEHRLGV